MSRKNIGSMLVLAVLIVLTMVVMFRGNDMAAVVGAMKTMNIGYLFIAMITALFFVAAEGCMIWYLMHALNHQARLGQCIRYSFIGFFFSGITPSATGGQPAQLYSMNKDGFKMADSTVVLMSVATIYKFVLVVMGTVIWGLWRVKLVHYLGNYEYLYYLGLFLNVLLVAALLFIMCSPNFAGQIAFGIEKFLVRIHILKASKERIEKLKSSVENYKKAVSFFIYNKIKIIVVIGFTIIQRCSVFLITAFVYWGLHLTGTSFFTVIVLQATIYIAVDMLPLPGAQGITELMYKNIFIQVFPGATLTASLCVSRGINFYFLLIVSAVTTILYYIKIKRPNKVIEKVKL